MVFAVRCPNPACRKYMLVEEADRGKVVPCLICKQPIRVPAEVPAAPAPNGWTPSSRDGECPQLSRRPLVPGGKLSLDIGGGGI